MKTISGAIENLEIKHNSITCRGGVTWQLGGPTPSYHDFPQFFLKKYYYNSSKIKILPPNLKC